MNPESDKALQKVSERESWRDYELDDSINYCDKRDHFERSCKHQPNHLKVEKKLKKRECFLKSLFKRG